MRLAWALLLAGCVAPPAVDWPPPPGGPSFQIIVSIDTWHAMIAVPKGGLLEEWGYAERDWYLEKEQGVSGAIRALLSPTDAVLEVVRTRHPWADRTHQPPAVKFEIDLSEKGYERLIAYLNEGRGRPILREGDRTWYESPWHYMFWHNCQHWAAGALRAAGLPLAPSRCITAGCLKHQLQNALGREGEVIR